MGQQKYPFICLILGLLFRELYLHFHCESLNEPLHLRRRAYLHERICLSHAQLRAIWTDLRQRHPLALFVY